MNDPNFPRETVIMVSSMSQLAAVYALLGGAASTAIAAASVAAPKAAPVADEEKPSGSSEAAPANEPSAASGEVLDSAGWPWDEKLHASTKGTTQDGRWRMKVGVARPDPKPGFPKDPMTVTGGTGTGAASQTASSGGTAANEAATSADDEDEFAAFRNAADKINDTDAAAKANIPARKWTDADLGALCNQAAVKFGDPAPIRELIAEFIPEGATPHSRNIPQDEREAFAQAVELKAGIEFAG